VPGEIQNQSFERTCIALVLIGKLYLYLTNCLATGAFYPLNRKVDKDCFLTYRYCAKASNQLSPAVYLAAFTYRTSQSPMIRSYRENYDSRNKTAALIKITNYAKGVIQQTGRHVEKTSSLKVSDNFNL